MATLDRIEPIRVVVIGGGIAALESVLALHELGEAQLEVTMIAPETEFTMRPLEVAEPFARGHSTPLQLEEFATEHRTRFRRTAVVSVDSQDQSVRCATGPDEPYDALIVAVGATAEPALPHAITFPSQGLHMYNGLMADVQEGYSRSIAFVVPKGTTWPLPLYELALMTAENAWSNYVDDIDLHLVTPELAPLDVFGPEASDAVRTLLESAGIRLHHGVVADVTHGGVVELGFGEELHVDRIVALPVLEGPRMEGLPSDAGGFIPVDDYGAIPGCPGAYAVGDATARPVKQGGLACQQAVVAAKAIAAAAGAPVEPEPFEPVLRGRLLTGGADRFLRREDAPRRSEGTTEPLWWPPAKVSSRYLAPYLESRGLVRLPVRAAGPGVDVTIGLRWPTSTGRG